MPLARTKLLNVLLFLAFAAFTATVSFAPARADEAGFDTGLADFAKDSYPDTEEGVAAIASSGSPRAAAVIGALGDNRLFFSASAGKIYIRDAAGALSDAKTGATVSPDPADLTEVRVNNRLRRAIESAMGDLTLMSPDPAKRLEAAAAVFKAHNPDSLPSIDAALAKETNPAVKAAFAHARAAVVALMPDTPENDKLKAIDQIKAVGDQDALGLLAEISAQGDGRVKTAADAGVASIKARIALWSYVQNIWYGLSLGSVLLLAAIGLAITFGVMGIINMAHGEMVMLGAYTTYVVQEYIRLHNPGLLNQSLFIAVPLAFLITGAIGILIERSIIRFLYGRPLETLLATFGLSLILQQAVRSIFGANNKEVSSPAFMSGTFDFGGLQITYGRMWIIVFALAVFAALQLVLRATPFGLKMRAVTQNRRMASAMGIDTNRIDALAFGLGSGIAGIAGVALSQIDNVSPNLGQGYIIDSFMVVVFGGVGNLWGTLVAAMTLGIANKFLEPMVGAVLGKIALLVFIILFIQKRPRGLFALKGRSVEA